MSQAKAKPKVETVQDDAFAKWVKGSIDLFGVTVTARALQTSTAEIRKIVKSGEIPKEIYSYAELLGFVMQSHME